jgi:hypothetical protein
MLLDVRARFSLPIKDMTFILRARPCPAFGPTYYALGTCDGPDASTAA